MRYFLHAMLFVVLLFAVPTVAQTINPCSILFGEGSIQLEGCNEFLRQRDQIAIDDARVQEIAQRISALNTSFATNQTDPDWVQRITPVVDALMNELSGIIQLRKAYIYQARLIEIAVKLHSGVPIPQVALDQLLVNTDTLSQSLPNLASLESDGAVLQTDLASVAPPTTDSPTDPEPETETEFGPQPEPPTNSEVLSLANGMCQSLEEIAAQNACIFRTGLVWLQAQELCADSTEPSCIDDAVTHFNTETMSEADWTQLMDDMNALDDPYAAVAVRMCQLNPQTDENNAPISLSQCAQVEYLEIAEDVNGDEDGDGLSNVNDFCPKLPAGNTPNPVSPGCPLSEAVAQRDDDSDGILNLDDLCPSTPQGDTPDPERVGCPVPTPDWSVLTGTWSFFYTTPCNNPDTGTAQLTVNGENGFWTFGNTTFPFVLVSESAGLPIFFTNYGNGITATWVLTDIDTLVATLSNGSADCRLVASR